MSVSESKQSPAAERVAELRALADSEVQSAQDQTWAWFQTLGEALPDEESEAQLAGIFSSGSPAAGIDGQTDGILVGWTEPAKDLDLLGKVVRHLGGQLTDRVGVPWVGKRFDAESETGTNTVTRLGMLAKLLDPMYKFRKVGKNFEAFDMATYVERGKLDPDIDVLVIDYQRVEGNPFGLRNIRDELVEVVPGTYLGKMIWTQGDDYRLLAYFALKTPVS